MKRLKTSVPGGFHARHELQRAGNRVRSRGRGAEGAASHRIRSSRTTTLPATPRLFMFMHK